ncbi:MAG: holo-ACP synthase [Candidatus Goldbacteria bacterium]|nr:holo-ACP synthase [Candidatus Goldiibacteriota bacterium]
MIRGIGIDITDVKKLKTAVRRNKRFLLRVFNQFEIDYCSGKKNSMLHFAGRFAVKEAFIKAVSDVKGIALNSISTSNNKNGKPEIQITPEIKKIMAMKKAKSILITISHTDTAAAAVCILEG